MIKAFYLKIILLLLSFCVSSHALATDFNVESIGIYLRSGWKIQIWDNGAGYLAFGSSSAGTARNPLATYDFEAIYNGFLNGLKCDESRDTFTVRIKGKGGSDVAVLHSKDYDLLIRIIGIAKANYVAFSPKIFDSILSKSPMERLVELER